MLHTDKVYPNRLKAALEKTANAIKANPKEALAITVGVIAASALSYINHNHAYKAGQIDQKYTDRATAQKALID